MPIYEYRCKHCGDEFDELVRMDTPDEDVACPKCGEHQAQRHISAVAGIVSGGSSVAAMGGGGGGGGCCGGGGCGCS